MYEDDLLIDNPQKLTYYCCGVLEPLLGQDRLI